MHPSGGYIGRPDLGWYGSLTSDVEQVAEGSHSTDLNGTVEVPELQVPPISSGAAGADGKLDSVDLPSITPGTLFSTDDRISV